MLLDSQISTAKYTGLTTKVSGNVFHSISQCSTLSGIKALGIWPVGHQLNSPALHLCFTHVYRLKIARGHSYSAIQDLTKSAKNLT